MGSTLTAMKSLFQFYLNSFRGLSREVWLLAVVMWINRSGAMVIPFLTLYLTKDLDFSLSQAGWVMSCFGLGSVAGNVVGGKLTDRYGYYPVMYSSLFLTGGMFFSLLLVDSLGGWCLGIFMTSFVAEIFRPANLTAISAYSKPENLTRSLSLVRLAINMGFATGPAVGGWLTQMAGFNALFYADAFTCIGAAILFVIALPQKPLILDKEEGPISREKPNILGNRPFMTFVLMQLLVMMGFMQFFSTLPVFLGTEMNLSEGEIGLFLSVNGLIIALTELPLIAALEPRFKPLKMVIFGAICVAVSLLVLLLSPWWFGAVWIYVIGITIGEMINFPFGQTHAMSFSTAHNRGRYMGIYSMAFSLGIIFAPGLGAQIADNISWQALWLFFAGVTGLAVLIGWGLSVQQAKE